MERIEGLPSMATFIGQALHLVRVRVRVRVTLTLTLTLTLSLTFIGQALHPTVRTCDTVGARLEQLRTQARPRLFPPPPQTHPPHLTHVLILTPSQYLGLSREVSNMV